MRRRVFCVVPLKFASIDASADSIKSSCANGQAPSLLTCPVPSRTFSGLLQGEFVHLVPLSFTKRQLSAGTWKDYYSSATHFVLMYTRIAQ